jgi:hypothetical protein
MDDYIKQNNLLKDRVRGVALGTHVGLYLTGRPGTGKTFTVRQTLNELKADYVYTNARLSPAALFDQLEANPDRVHVIDDVPLLWANKDAQPIIMAALGGKGGEVRRVSYRVKRDVRECHFRGGVIGISNCPLRDDPLAKAIASRATVHTFEPTDDELAGYIRHLAGQGFCGLNRADGEEVAKYLFDTAAEGESRTDLRSYEKAAADYTLWKRGASSSHWKDLVKSSVRQLVAGEIRPQRSRADRIAFEQSTARQIITEYPFSDQRADRERVWLDRVPESSEKSLYRRLKEQGLTAKRRPAEDAT